MTVHAAAGSNALPIERPAQFDQLISSAGAALAVHLAVIVAIKCALGVAADLWWLSHVCLGLAAAALLLRSCRLLATVTALVTLPHLIWLFDAVVGFGSGRFPLGLAGYLPGAAWPHWVATAHHFYLLPLLALLLVWWSRRAGVADRPTPGQIAALGMMVLAALTCAGRLLPAELNVNFAFALFPRVDEPLGRFINSLSWPVYLVVLNALGLAFIIVPGRAVAMALMVARPRGRAEGQSISSSASLGALASGRR